MCVCVWGCARGVLHWVHPLNHLRQWINKASASLTHSHLRSSFHLIQQWFSERAKERKGEGDFIHAFFMHFFLSLSAEWLFANSKRKPSFVSHGSAGTRFCLTERCDTLHTQPRLAITKEAFSDFRNRHLHLSHYLYFAVCIWPLSFLFPCNLWKGNWNVFCFSFVQYLFLLLFFFYTSSL